MYRHSANSIKETTDKMFVSQAEKDLYDSYESTMRNIDDTYLKSEVDEVMKQTEDVKMSLSSDNGVMILDNNYKGFVEVVNIQGRTLQDPETLEVSAVGEKINDNQYNISLKAMNAGNLLDLSDKLYNENDIRVLYNVTFLSTVEKYGDRGLKVTANDANTRGCAFTRIPDYPVDLHVKMDVVGNGLVSLKDLDSVASFYSGLVSNKTVRFTIPANSGLRKIELDAGSNSDESVIYDNIIISTFNHEDDTHWEEYKEDIIEIVSPVQLHGGYKINSGIQTSPTYDELCVIGNKLCIKNWMRTIKLNDFLQAERIKFLGEVSEGFYRMNIYVEQNVIHEKGYNDRGYRFLLTASDKLPTPENTGVLSDFIIAEATSYTNDIYLYVKLNKATVDSYLGSTEKEKFINYLSDLDVTVTYESHKAEIIELCDLEKMSLQLFENTVIDIESSVKPSNIDVISPTNIGSVLSQNITELDILEEDIKRINKISSETMLDVSLNGSNVCVVKSNPGFIDEVEINGKTYVNMMPSLDKINIYANNSTFGRNTDGSIYWEALEAPTVHQFAYIDSKYFKRLKPNTKYTIVVKVRENTTSLFMLCDSGNNSDGTPGQYIFNENVYIRNKAVGIISATTMTREDIDTVGRRYSIYLPKGVTGKIVIEDIMLFEGDIPKDYIKLLKGKSSFASVANNDVLEFKSVNSCNLFDGEYEQGYIKDGTGINDNYNACAISSANFIPCIGNRSYDIRIEDIPEDLMSGSSITIYFYDINKEYLGENTRIYKKPSISNTSITFTAHASAKYFKFRLYGNPNLGITHKTNVYKTYIITKDTIKPSFDYEYDSTIIDLTKYGIEGGLKSLPDGKKDRIFKKDGKYYIEQVAGYIKLTSDIPDNRWFQSSNNSLFTSIRTYMYRTKENPDFLTPYTEDYIRKSNIISSVLPAVEPSNTTDPNREKSGVSVYHEQYENNGEIRIAILKSELDTQDLAGFKKWLDDNGGLEVIYELAEPRIIELEEDLDLLLYEGSSEISIEGGSAIPEVTFKVGGYIRNTVNQMMDKVQQLEEEQLSRLKLILESTYSADLSLHRTMLMSLSRLINNIDYDLIDMIRQYIESGNFNREELETQIDLFTLIDKIDFENSISLLELIEEKCSTPEEILQ